MKCKSLLLNYFVFMLVCANALEAAENDIPDSQIPLDIDSLQKSATNGNPNAQNVYAYCLIHGQGRPQSVQRIIKDSERELGNSLERAENAGYVPFNLVRGSEDSHDITNIKAQDTPEAQEWKTNYLKQYEKLVKFKTSVEEKEAKQAADLFEASASKGCVDSMLILADILVDGKRVPQNLEHSFELTRQAAMAGSPFGMNSLGLKYARGRGVAKDINASMEWLEKAFKKGYVSSGVTMSKILKDGGLDGKDEGYPKDLKRAYALGRGIQLANQENSQAYQWGTEIISNTRQNLEPDQLIAAENEAETIGSQLSSINQPAPQPPIINLKNHKTLTKNEWKAQFTQACPDFSTAGMVQMSKQNFLETCGEPDKTQSVDDEVYWYFACKDGDIQFVLNRGSLAVGEIIGHVNDF